MIFNTLVLCNIGLYKEENIFDLTTKNGNIILIGGKNGSGKTTIIESVKLCLYGNKILGLTNKQYDEYIRKLINKDKKEGYILLELTYTSKEKQNKFTIKRSWKIENKIKEEFLLLKNGNVYNEIHKENWQNFISSELIPQGLIDFFLFDGEKIEKLANDFKNVSFINDIKNILGITAIEDIYNILGIIEKKKQEETNTPQNIYKELENLTNEKEKIENTLNQYLEEIAQINQKISELKNDLKLAEIQLYQKGGELFKNLESLKIKRELLIKNIEDAKSKIKEYSSYYLPLAIGVDLMQSLINQLEIEKEIKFIEIKQNILQQTYNLIIETLKEEITISENIETKLKNIFETRNTIDGKIIHNLTEQETENIKAIFKNLEKIIPEIRNLLNSLEKDEEELSQIELSLQNVPEESMLAPYIKRVREIENQIEKLITEKRNIEDNIKRVKRDIKTIDYKINKLKNILNQHTINKKTIELINKTKNFLQAFQIEFKNKKLAILKQEILTTLSELLRKNNLISDLKIDTKTFSITLYDKNNRIIHFDKLSAGERQIFAISFLWALAKTSGRNIPVIIDTPLSRLDKKHKENLAKNYFPKVSNQVIILSTDSEIDEDLYKIMENNISHSYTLEYNDKCSCTNVKDGYFTYSYQKVESLAEEYNNEVQ